MVNTALAQIVSRPRGIVSRYPLGEIISLGNLLKTTVRNHAQAVLDNSLTYGVQVVTTQLKAYGEQYQEPEEPLVVTPAVEAVVAKTAAQVSTLIALAATEASPEMLTGGGGKLGILRESEPLGELANWVVFMAGAAFLAGVPGYLNKPVQGETLVYRKVAVAALDQHTTPCCLAVHGQVQPLDQPFHLTEPPAFAPHIDHPPFHWYCRTAIALHLERYDTGITQAMRDSAQVIIAERAAGGTGYRAPASALV
jgi:hypothetical protein